MEELPKGIDYTIWGERITELINNSLFNNEPIKVEMALIKLILDKIDKQNQRNDDGELPV